MPERTAQLVSIPSPRFSRYERVFFYWNGETRIALVTNRRYCFDEAIWEYEVAGRYVTCTNLDSQD